MDEQRDILFARLKQIRSQLKNLSISDLFTLNPKRFEEFSTSIDDMILDYSKLHMNKDVLNTLFKLAKVCDVEEKRDAMYRGDKINITENRAVLHIALRNKLDNPIYVDNRDIMQDVHDGLEKMEEFANGIRDGKILSSSNESFTDIVNIGIGGSDLGPAMIVEALQFYKNHLNVHFVSNVDGDHVNEVIKKLNLRK